MKLTDNTIFITGGGSGMVLLKRWTRKATRSLSRDQTELMGR
jgi:short-subunit dehydrogenase involved in D-alanine esterification of teichoic acids